MHVLQYFETTVSLSRVLLILNINSCLGKSRWDGYVGDIYKIFNLGWDEKYIGTTFQRFEKKNDNKFLTQDMMWLLPIPRMYQRITAKNILETCHVNKTYEYLMNFKTDRDAIFKILVLDRGNVMVTILHFHNNFIKINTKKAKCIGNIEFFLCKCFVYYFFK